MGKTQEKRAAECFEHEVQPDETWSEIDPMELVEEESKSCLRV